MPFALGIVTVLALLMTVGMGVVTWRLVREERRRSAARLSVLTAELARHDARRDMRDVRDMRDMDERPPASHPPAPGPPALAADSSRQPSSRVEEAGRTPVSSNTPTDLFQTRPDETEGWTRRLAGFGIAGVVLVVISAAVLTFPGDRRDPLLEEAQVPVELLTLTHEHHDGMLAISGVVRSPGDGPEERHLTVMALALDRDGTVVATGQASLEPTDLPAGTESTFVVSLAADDATRYRISFLFGDATVPHLDRRRALAAALRPTDS